MSTGSDQVYASTVSSGLSGGSIQSLNNWLSFPWNVSQSTAYTQEAGRAMCVRAENSLGPSMTGYPDAPYSIPLIAPYVKNQTWNYGTMLNSGFNPNNPYKTYYAPNPPGANLSTLNEVLPIKTATCAVSGYTKPFAP